MVLLYFKWDLGGKYDKLYSLYLLENVYPVFINIYWLQFRMITLFVNNYLNLPIIFYLKSLPYSTQYFDVQAPGRQVCLYNTIAGLKINIVLKKLVTAMIVSVTCPVLATGVQKGSWK